jgi:hypothetical protein
MSERPLRADFIPGFARKRLKIAEVLHTFQLPWVGNAGDNDAAIVLDAFGNKHVVLSQNGVFYYAHPTELEDIIDRHERWQQGVTKAAELMKCS